MKLFDQHNFSATPRLLATLRPLVFLFLGILCAQSFVLLLPHDAKAQSVNPMAEESKMNVLLPSDERPEELQGVQIDEKLGQTLDGGIAFKDENGKDVTLADYYAEGKPLIISPVYYACPGLCNFHLNGLMDALKEMDWSAGEKYTLLAVSFDSKETPDLGLAKKHTYMGVYDRPGTEDGFRFLTTSEDQVQKFINAVGFKMKWVEETSEWSHASAAIIVNPSGKITRYLPGILFDARDVKIALNETMAGKVGTFIDALVLYCFHYNPTSGKYTPYFFNIMKLGGLATVFLLLIWLIPFWLRSRRESHKPAARSAT